VSAALASGDEMYGLIRELYPLCRSLTGDGVRETLRILGRFVPLEVHEVPSGTPVFDWTVPREWNLREAWIATPDGRRVVDARDSNLHVVSYSTPLRRRVPLAELQAHLHSLPDRPDWIPYRTSYYHESWGFCVSERQRAALTDPEYEVCIDATLAPGSLCYGEWLLPGRSAREILISTHVCHPSLCNDNLSGIAVAALLARRLREREREYSYRFLFVPGTIGSITWLARNAESAHRIAHGLTLVCLGDGSPFTWKRTLRGDAEVDRAAALTLRESGFAHQLIDWFPFGYDERQYGSPGFRLAVGSLMRARHGRFPEYHTSADDLDFVAPGPLQESLEVVSALLDVLDGNRVYRSTSPFGEPQLGRRGLYRAMGGEPDVAELELAMLWVLALADGAHALLDVAERSGLRFAQLRRAAELLHAHALLEPCTPRTKGEETACASC
jgi:aminopeptidase-like protein